MCPKRALLIKIERTIIHFNIQVIDSSAYSNISVTGWLFFFFSLLLSPKEEKMEKEKQARKRKSSVSNFNKFGGFRGDFIGRVK